ncbi:TPA: glycoside hydrolase family 3 C-terminal domain-containing protein [Streptococcus suis]|nr:glycoside hydrolase family 3 C-terminal domain-containing protein [Streptococcus suis]
MKEIKDIVKSLTLEEKASLCQGSSFWETKEIKEKGIPAILMTDGPHGLRKESKEKDQYGMNLSLPATCFPTASSIANSWNEDLIWRVGEALGKECVAENVSILLGPGVNIKRSPLCGRNFEYFSEDPYLSSNMAKSQILGIQSMGIGTSLKHFAVNNQETQRMTVDAKVDERTLREIYLASFETAIKIAKPWTIMAAYNKVNGEYCCEHSHLLNEILRDEWQYDGVVLSDWGATNDQIVGIQNGFDLRMPFNGDYYTKVLIEAVETGKLAECVLDKTVTRILTLVKKCIKNELTVTFSKEEHHQLAVEAAIESAVLLKNEHSTLPITRNTKIAIIGRLAQHIRYQGGGSSHVIPSKYKTLLNVLEDDYPDVEYTYSPGYRLKQDVDDSQYISDALIAAETADVVLFCLGLPNTWESEGLDRKHLEIPKNQQHLLKQLSALNKPIICLLFSGSPVEMPWLVNVDSLLYFSTAGQGMSEAAWKLVFGERNPSAKLAETFPISLSHTPTSLTFPEKEQANYAEGIYVGYRYYDKKKISTLFDFGFGLSYTSWEYQNINISQSYLDIAKEESLIVTVDVTNIGSMAGQEIVQLYVSKEEPKVHRPIKELKGFKKVFCLPGETKTVTFILDRRSFAYYEEKIHDWYVEDGNYLIMIGKSVRDIVQQEILKINNNPLPVMFSPQSTVGEIREHPAASEVLKAVFSKMMPQKKTENKIVNDITDEENFTDTTMAYDSMAEAMPLIKISDMTAGLVTVEAIHQIVEQLNQAVMKSQRN